MNKSKIKRVKKEIKDARESLILEREEIGFYYDHDGDRYWIAEQYYEIADYEGLIDYYEWFYEAFNEDIGTPEMLVIWIDTFYRKEILDVFSKRFAELEDMNTHLIPLLASIYTGERAKWEWSNYAMLEYAEFTCEKLIAKISDDLIEFIKQLYGDSTYRSYKDELINYYALLEDVAPGVRRTHTLSKMEEHLVKMEQYVLDYCSN